MNNWLEDQDRKQRTAARQAGYRAPDVGGTWSPAIALDPDAPPGAYPIDRLAAKLERKREHEDDYTDALWEQPYRLVRLTLNPDLINHMIRSAFEARDQAPRDARALSAKIDQLISGISEFIQHAPGGDFHLKEEGQISFDEVKSNLIDTKSLLQRIRNQQETIIERNSKEDLQTNIFLRAMAICYEHLVGKRPGKTNNGLFAEFCVLAWQSIGWEGEEETIGKRLRYRIGVGAHNNPSRHC